MILATGSWQSKIPHGAPLIANDIGLNGIPAWDIAAGCAGFGYALSNAADMVRAGTAQYVLALGVETMTVAVDPTDRNTGFLFGDGAGAVVVGPSETNGISPQSWARMARTATRSRRTSTSRATWTAPSCST